jgi:acetone carboxylase gamma subunit
MKRFYTEYLVINQDNKLECRKCGYVFCSIRENYKEHALFAEILPSTIGPIRPEDENFCMYREFYCPGCATLLDVDPHAPNDPIAWDIKLKV